MQYSQWDVQRENQREKLRWIMEKKCEKKGEKETKEDSCMLTCCLSDWALHIIITFCPILSLNPICYPLPSGWADEFEPVGSWWVSSQTSWIGKVWVPTTGLSGCEHVLFHDYVSVVQMYMGVDQGMRFWIDLCGSMSICVHCICPLAIWAQPRYWLNPGMRNCSSLSCFGLGQENLPMVLKDTVFNFL